MKRPHFAGLLIGTLFLGVTLTLAVQHVRAAGIPETNAFTYSGYLAGADGTPVNTPQAINLYVYNAAGGGNPLCQVAPGTPTSVVSGRFQIQLPPECNEVVKQNADLWLEVQVGGLPLGRTKLGAVPYAMTANYAGETKHAVDADSAAAASGALAASIATLALKSEVPVITPWQSYVPEVTNEREAAPTYVSTGRWRRVGDSIEVNVKATIDACSGAGQVRFSLPAGLAVDELKLPFVFSQVGTGYVYYRVGGKLESFAVVSQGTANLVVLESPSAGAGGMTCAPFATTQPMFRMQFSLPIQGW